MLLSIHQLVGVLSDALELMSKLLEAIDDDHPVPQSRRTHIRPHRHLRGFRFCLYRIILFRCEPDRDPFVLFLFHAVPPFFGPHQWICCRRSGSELLSGIRRFPAVSSPTTSDRRSDCPTSEATAHLSLPIEVESSLAPCFLLSPAKPHSLSFTGGPGREEGSPSAGRVPLAATIRREGRLQGCKALRPLHPYSLALGSASTTGSP